MKNCKSCGTQMGDEARFCTACGADNGAPQQQEYQPQPETAEIPNNNNQPVGGGSYYQPGNNYSAAPNEQFQQPPYQQAPYQQTPYQQPPQKKKISGCGIALIVVGAIAALIIIAFIVLAIVGFNIIDKHPEYFEDIPGFSESFDYILYGSEDGTTYSNYSVNLVIDPSGSNMQFADYSEIRQYFGNNADSVETYIYDPDTYEDMLVMILEGTEEEVSTDLGELVKEIAEDICDEYENPVISDVYTRTIAGVEYTCVDIEVAFQYDDSTSTKEVYTLCFLQRGDQYLEIQFITYPEETGNTADTLIDNYFFDYNEYDYCYDY